MSTLESGGEVGRLRLLFVVVGGVVLLLSVFLQPRGPYAMGLPGGPTFPEMSPFHAVTGLPGPTCGITRSFVNTAHLRLGDAFRSHLLGPPLFAMVLGAWVTAVVAELRRHGGPTTAPGSAAARGRPRTAVRRYVWPAALLFLAAWGAKIAMGWY